MASDQQIAKIKYLTRSAGLDFEEVLDLADDVTGRSVFSLEELSIKEASDLIESLEDDIGS